MVFKVPASKASLKQNVFEFEVPVEAASGKTKMRKFSVPKLEYVNADMRTRMAANGIELNSIIQAGDKPSPEQMHAAEMLTRELFDKYAPGLYELVDGEQLQAIQGAWQEASGISMGESSPSAD